MGRVFKTRYFARWMRKTELSDEALWVVKKRVGLSGRGKRGGARTLVATNKGNRWFVVYGFEKNDRANISDDELEALKDLAAQLLARTGKQLAEALNDGTLSEICHDH